MSKRILNNEEIKQLLNNNNVAGCSQKSITYNSTFKIEAVKQYQDGFTAREIFLKAKLDLMILGRDHPRTCLKRWRKIVAKKGFNTLARENRGQSGGRPKTKNITDQEKIEYLEAKVAYLKAENDFLAKLRAQKKVE